MIISTFLLAAFTLVGAEKSAKVVIPENAEPSTRLCVEELTNYVAKISGEILKVEKVGGGGQWNCKDSLIIGTLTTLGEAAPKVAREALAKSTKWEAAWMGTEGGNLWIVGKEATADMYATYHFLETKLVVRWLQAATAEDPGDYYPIVKVEKAGGGGESSGLVIQDFQEFREPDFILRRFGQQGSDTDVIPYAGEICGYRNGFQYGTNKQYWNINPDDPWYKAHGKKLYAEHRAFYEPRCSRRLVSLGGHWMCRHFYPWFKAMKTHPEFFALQGGIRGGKTGRTCQYCLSNPDLMDGLVKGYVELFKKNGGKGIFAFGQSDETHGWCECENCRKLDGPGEGPDGNNVCVSSRIAWFADNFFRRLKAELPEVICNYEPYAVYRNLPKKGGIDPERVRCQYSPHGRCYVHRFDDPKCVRNVETYNQMLEWQKKLPHGLWTYEYFTDTEPYYICREMMESEDLKLYKKLGMIGWYNEGFETGAKFCTKEKNPPIADVFPSNWQWLYVTGHLLWNADLDWKTLVDDAESKYYGPAYPAMKKYHALRRELWASYNDCVGYPYGDPRRPNLLNAEGAKEKLLALLDEAEKLAEGSSSRGCISPKCTIYKHRLSRDRYWLDRYWVKPNLKVREEAANALRIPKLPAPKLDGDLSDAVWKKALYVQDLLRVEMAPKKPIDENRQTRIGITTDGENLYFLVDATDKEMATKGLRLKAKKHDDPAWGDDNVEIMIFPPAVENCYYHIAVNADGVIYDSRCPGNDTSYDLGVEAKAGRTATGWTLEIKVPSKNLIPIKIGDKWRMQMGRGRPASGGCTTLGGTVSHDVGGFKVFEFVSPDDASAGAATRIELPAAGERSVTTVDPKGADKVTLNFDLPIIDIQQMWMPNMKLPKQDRKWRESLDAAPQSGVPFVTYFNRAEKNRLAFGVEACEWDTRIASRINQARGVYEVTFTVVAGPGGVLKPFKVTLDRRDIVWTHAYADWRESLTYPKGKYPDGAWKPVYCTWYAAHAAFDQAWVEKTATIAADFGFKTFILDDGWSYDDAKRDCPETIPTWYQDVGKWNAFSAKKFPDIKAHRECIRKLGLKYVVWVGPYMIGTRSEAFRRWGFDKDPNVEIIEGNAYADVLNGPLMESITVQLEKLMKEYDLDGLKLDFLDYIRPSVDKPRGAAAGAYMEGLMARLKKIRPDGLFEYCQGYSTPYTAHLATQFRSGDVPFEWQPNLMNLAQIRIKMGDAVPIHSDPIYWADGETKENIDRHFMASMAGVPMLSMELGRMSDETRATVREWLKLYAERIEKFHRRGHWEVVYRNGSLSYLTSVLGDEIFVIALDAADAPAIRRAIGTRKPLVFNLAYDPLDLGNGLSIGPAKAIF